MKMYPVRYVPLLIVIALIVGCASTRFGVSEDQSVNGGISQAEQDHDGAVSQSENGIVQAGDLVQAYFTIRLETGDLLYTNRPHISGDPKALKHELFKPAPAYGPDFVLTGSKGMIPGLDLSLYGMKPGERRQIAIPPKDAYGERDDKKTRVYPSWRKISKAIELPLEKYSIHYGKQAQMGDTVTLNPYFRHKVTGIVDSIVILTADIHENRTEKESFGQTDIVIEEDHILFILRPEIGAEFGAKDHRGIITKIMDKGFIVDANHPLAGKALYLDIEITAVYKSDKLESLQIEWSENHDQGYIDAHETGRPQIMVLYAGWCPWSRRLFEETMGDPRVEIYRDDFIWTKVDSDRDPDYKHYYQQNSFPTILFIDSDGEIKQRIDTYQEPAAFSMALKGFLGHGKAIGNQVQR